MKRTATPPHHSLLSLFVVFVLVLSLMPEPGVQAAADELASVSAASSVACSDADLSDGNLAIAGPLGIEGQDDGPSGAGTNLEAIADPDPDSDSTIMPLLAPPTSQLSQEVALQSLSGGSDDGVPLVAEVLAGEPTRFVNQAVTLDEPEPMLGSFTVDSTTYAVTGEGEVELAAVGNRVLAAGLVVGSAGDLTGVEGLDVLEGGAADSDDGASALADSEAEGVAGPMTLEIPEFVSYEGATYAVTSAGPRALAGCGVDVVALPTSVASVDEAATRGSAVKAIEVADGNPYLASYEGVLYDADYSSLLLIPEGKKGVVRIHSNTSAIPPSAFSHCALVTSVEVDAGNESFYVEDGVLYEMTKPGELPIVVEAESRLLDPGFVEIGEKELSRAAGVFVLKITTNGGTVGGQSGATATFRATEDGSGNATITLPGATRPGYKLSHYAVSPWGNKQPGSSVSVYFTEHETITRTGSAVWTADPEYTVSWNANGGTASATSTKVKAGNTATAPSASRTGYNFLGWYTAAVGGTRVCGSGGKTGAINSNVTYYAHWSAKTYTLTWDANGGSVSPSSSAVNHGSATTAPTPSRTGYSFQGWWTAREGGSKRFDGDASTGAVMASATLYACWSPSQYEVSLDAAFPVFASSLIYEGYGPNGISKDAGVASVTATFDTGMPAATMPRADGYAFQGYFDDSGTQYYDASGNSVCNWDKPGNATLHGRWSLVRHELTLDVGNGEVPSAAARGWSRDAGDAGLYRLSYSIEWVEESGGSPRIQLPVPATKPGYSAFDGWVGPSLSKPSKSVIVQPWELADKAYSGAFSGLVGYTVSLDLAGGRFDEAPEGWSEDGGSWSRGFTVESEGFSLPTPVRDGYSFQGWRAVGDGGLGEPAKDVTVPKGSWGDRAWVASWEAVSYSIAYDLAGGTLSGQPTAYTVESPDFELPQPTRAGYSFQGWQVEGASGAGLSQSGTVTTVCQGTWGDLEATATWATVSYTASLDLDGGSFGSAPAGWTESNGKWGRTFTVESEAFLLPMPTRTGYEFKGWAALAADGSLGSPAASVNIPKGTVGDRSFKAVWQARSYMVTWHYAGQVIDGKESVMATQAYGEPIAFPGRPSEADPAREHYSFEGWFTEREGGERVLPAGYLLERDATFYARWVPVEYVVHLHLGDDDAYAEHAARIEKDGQALPMAPDGHFDMAYTVEDEVTLPRVTDDPAVMKPVREGMSFVGWVECGPDGSFDANLVPSTLVTLPKGSHGERHFRAVWAFALRFEVPSAVGFRFDLADDPAFADEPYGPVQAVSGDGVELRSLSLGQLAVADVAVDVAGAQPDAIVTDRAKVFLRVRDASLPDPGYGWVPLPTTSAPEGIDRFDLADVGFGDANPIAPLASKPLRYEIEVQDPTTTLAGEVDNLPLARVVFTVKGLW